MCFEINFRQANTHLFCVFQLCRLPRKEFSHYGKQHWKATIQKVDNVETEADLVMKWALLPIFTGTFGILPMTSTSFCPKISFLTIWFCQSILLIVISRRSHKVFPKMNGSKLPALFVLMRYHVRHLNARKLETSKISPIVRDLVFSFVSPKKIPLDILTSSNVQL